MTDFQIAREAVIQLATALNEIFPGQIQVVESDNDHQQYLLQLPDRKQLRIACQSHAGTINSGPLIWLRKEQKPFSLTKIWSKKAEPVSSWRYLVPTEPNDHMILHDITPTVALYTGRTSLEISLKTGFDKPVTVSSPPFRAEPSQP